MILMDFGHTNEHNFPRSEEFNLLPLGGSFFHGNEMMEKLSVSPSVDRYLLKWAGMKTRMTVWISMDYLS